MKMTILTACEACAKMGRSTNCCDVKITMWIMIGIISVVVICAVSFVYLKCKELKAHALSETNKRNWAVEDKRYKTKSELLDMKLKKLNDADYISEIDRALNEK